MVASVATSGFGCLLKKGDGGVGAGTKGAVEWGTSTAKMRIRRKVAGADGNGKNVTVAVSGSTFVTTAVDANQVSITAPTTATTAQVIAYLYSIPAFVEHWEADYGSPTAGDGTGTVTARTVTATSGGTDGAELFTNVAEVKSISGPNTQSQIIDVTHMESDNSTREFLPTLIDPGEMGFAVNFLPGNATHQGIRTDQKNRTRRNWKLVFTDTLATVYSMAGFVTGCNITAEIENVIQAQLNIKLTSWPE